MAKRKDPHSKRTKPADRERLERHYQAAVIGMPGFISPARHHAIVWAAHLEDNLERLLWHFMIDDPREKSTLFNPEGPGGSFGAKTRLAYLLGLIAEDECADLKSIAKIRNRFAHSAAPYVSFDDSSVRDLVLGLKILRLEPESLTSADLEKRFTSACSSMSYCLRYRTRCVLAELPPRRSSPKSIERPLWMHEQKHITGLSKEEAVLFGADIEEVSPGVYYFSERFEPLDRVDESEPGESPKVPENE